MTSDKYQLPPTDPRDALPHAHPAACVTNWARSLVERQLTSTDDSHQFITLSVHLCRNKMITRYDDDVLWRNFLSSEFGTKFGGSILISGGIPIFLNCSVE